ncbi:MAG: diiron oxygenase [Thermoanaerobaculia bacterium]
MTARIPASSERLERATRKLTALSVTAYANPHGRFCWTSSASTERPAMSERLLPLAGLPVFGQLSDEQRWRLALLEAVSFFSLNISGERELMAGLTRRLGEGRPAFLSRYLRHFLEEENAHTVVFARFCLDYGGAIFADRQVRFPREFLPGEEEFLFFARVLVFEEIAHFYNRSIATDEDVWSLAREINRYHAEEETRHLAFGRLLVAELWERLSPAWDGEGKRRIGQYLTLYVTTVLQSYVNPEVYRAIGLPAGTRQQILQSPHWISLADQSTGRITRWLQKLGVTGHA